MDSKENCPLNNLPGDTLAEEDEGDDDHSKNTSKFLWMEKLFQAIRMMKD